jgi:pimeloyl-ACP methyl ester carboxylesterase
MAIWRLLGDRTARLVFWLARPVGLVSYLGWRPSWSSVRAFLASPVPHMAATRAKCLLILNLDARPWLAELTCPTFVMTGSFDPVVPVAAGRTLATSIPGARLCRVPGSHVPHLAKPAAAAQAVNAWLMSLANRL